MQDSDTVRNEKLASLEPLALYYLANKRVLMFTPIIAGSIFCGVTWGIISLQYFNLLTTRAKGQTWKTTLLATYLFIASTGYLCLISAFMSWMFAQNFGWYAAAFDLTYTSWLFLIATVSIHAVCQLFYAWQAYQLTGRSKLLGLFLFTLITSVIGVGFAIKFMIADIVVHVSASESSVVKIWIGLTAFTDLMLTTILTIAHLRGQGRHTGHSTWVGKLRLLFVDAQLPATLLSIGLMVLVLVSPASSFTHLWLGFPLIYTINVLSTIAHNTAVRSDVEADAQGLGSISEKGEIPPVENRPSFTFSPFPEINIRRASDKMKSYTAPIIMPAISGVRRASQFLGVLPPATKPAKKRGFPFKKTDSGRESPAEIHPSSLHYPLRSDEAPMGEGELIPRDKALDRPHALVRGETEPSTRRTPPDSDTPPLPGHLSDPFAHPTPKRGGTPSDRGVSMDEAIEAHEIFEMPATPDIMSPKSYHSALPSPGLPDEA